MSPQTLYPAACHLGLSAARLLPASLTPGNGPILVSVKEKLTADPDSEVATTSLRVSLMCPLGKMRLTVPCRALTCAHLQSFDAALYLQMNEKKPTWTCPVCDKKAPYESLIIDGLFMEILNSCSDCDEIQFMEDGSWCPMKPKKEASEVCPPPGYGLDGLQYSPVQEGNQSENKKRVEVIDLTIESSSDEEDLPPTKKHCPVTSAAIPALPGSKGALTSGHQPSSVLRSPAMGTLGSDFLSSLPLHEYPPAFPLGADIQGLDLFSFLQTESQGFHSVFLRGENMAPVFLTPRPHHFIFTPVPS